jgi:RNA ligase
MTKTITIAPISEYFKEVEAGNLTAQRKDGLVLFDYNKTCSFEGHWNHVTLNARGIVFEEATGKLVARPLAKFFNLTEPLCQVSDLPVGEDFLALDKCDGSCGICFFYNGQWYVNTRGSFNSDQAAWAKKWLDANVDTSVMEKEFTYVFEIIYPDNKIVIDYNGKETLVLLAAIHTETGVEYSYHGLKKYGNLMGVEVVKAFHYKTLEELFAAQGKLSSNEEGFVVWYTLTNFRFKLKGEEYCKIHRMLSNLTPLAFWRAIDYQGNLEIPVDYLAGLPEEFRETTDLLKREIEKLHKEYFLKIQTMAESCPKEFESKYARYTYMKETFGEQGSLVLYFIEGKLFKIKNAIHLEVRPTGNRIPGVDLSRIERIVDDNG